MPGSNQGCGATAQAILDGWSRSLKFGFRFHRRSLWGKRVLQIIQWFLVFGGPIVLEPQTNTSMLEPQPKKLDARSLKFEFRLHSPGSNSVSVQKQFPNDVESLQSLINSNDIFLKNLSVSKFLSKCAKMLCGDIKKQTKFCAGEFAVSCVYMTCETISLICAASRMPWQRYESKWGGYDSNHFDFISFLLDDTCTALSLMRDPSSSL